MGSRSLYYLISRNSLLILILIIVGKIFNLSLPNGGNLIIFLILVSFISGGIRFLLRDMLLYISDFKKKSQKVAIYGAGASGAQLEATLRLSYEYSIEFFIDDNKKLWRRSLNDIPIRSINFLQNNIHKIDQVLIAIPSLKKVVTKRY